LKSLIIEEFKILKMGKCSTDPSEEDVDNCRGIGEPDNTFKYERVLLASNSLFKPISSIDAKKRLFLSGSTILEPPLHKLKGSKSTFEGKVKAYLERVTTSKYHFDPDEEKLLSAKPYATVANGRNSPVSTDLSSEKKIGV